MLGNFLQTIAIIWLVKSEKSKPVEKRGRKAKGLKSPSWDDDSQVAEDGIDFFFASLVQNQALFVETLHSSSDKGKPVEKRRRKAKDLKSRPRDHDSQVAEARSSLGNLSVFIEEEKSMTLKFNNTRNILNTAIVLAIFVAFFFNPISALAMAGSNTNFSEFSQSVQNGQSDVLTGVYVSDVLALPVVQQPYGNAGYVSNNDGEVTQFRMASQFGNVGILAHNHLSGSSFSQLAIGQEVRLVNGDGSVEYFVIAEILRYQALQPNSPYSSFRNLNKDETLSAEQMFKRVYFGDRHVTFQTCIEAEGNASWGRLFVIAIPKSEYVSFERLNNWQ